MSDEKEGKVATGWLRSLARGIKEAADLGVKSLVDRFEGEVRVDVAGRRLWLADRVVERAVRAGAERLEEFTLLDFAWRDDAYGIRAMVKSHTVAVSVLPCSARWTLEDVTVSAETLSSPSLEGEPVANWFVARFVELLGGTAIAAALLTRPMPEGLRWDGREVTWRRPLDLGMTGLRAALANGAAATATFSHDDDGLWITVHAELPIAVALVKDVLTLLGAKAFGVMRR